MSQVTVLYTYTRHSELLVIVPECRVRHIVGSAAAADSSDAETDATVRRERRWERGDRDGLGTGRQFEPALEREALEARLVCARRPVLALRAQQSASILHQRVERASDW